MTTLLIVAFIMIFGFAIILSVGLIDLSQRVTKLENSLCSYTNPDTRDNLPSE